MYSNPRNIWQNQAVGAPRLHPGEEMSMQKKEKRKRKKKELGERLGRYQMAPGRHVLGPNVYAAPENSCGVAQVNGGLSGVEAAVMVERAAVGPVDLRLHWEMWSSGEWHH